MGLNMKNLSIIAFSILLTSLMPCYGLFESISSFTLQNNKQEEVEILTLGDFHDIDEKTDSRDKKILFKSMEKWAKDSEKTLFILEMSDDFFKANEEVFAKYRLQMDQEKYAGMYYALPRMAQNNNNQYKNITFMFGDLRGTGVMQLFLFFTAVMNNPAVLARAFDNKINCNYDQLDSVLVQNQQLKKNFFTPNGGIKKLAQILLGLGNTSVETCIQEIQENLKVIKEFRDRFENTSANYQIMDTYFQEILVLSKQAKEFFSQVLGKNFNVPCSQVFVVALAKHQSFLKLLKEFHNWVHPLGLSITDAGFAMHILNNINSYERIILFAGNNHTVEINNLLLKPVLKDKLKVQTIFQGGLLEKTKVAQYSESRFTQDQLENLFSRAFKQKHSNAIKQPAPDARICWYCVKEEAINSKLLRCGQCKEALYCSKKCQGLHWKNGHKEACKLEDKKTQDEAEASTETVSTASNTLIVPNNPNSPIFTWLWNNPFKTTFAGISLAGVFGYFWYTLKR